MTTPAGLHLDGATQMKPRRGSWTSIPRYPPCSGRRTSSRNMGLPKWNPAGVHAPPRHYPPCSGRRTSARNMGLLKWNPFGVITEDHGISWWGPGGGMLRIPKKGGSTEHGIVLPPMAC